MVVAREQCSSKYHEKATTVRLGGIGGAMGDGDGGWTDGGPSKR